MQAVKGKVEKTEKMSREMGRECSEVKGTFFRNKKLNIDHDKRKDFPYDSQVNNNDKHKKHPEI